MSIGQVRSRTMMGLIGASALGLSACFGGVVTDGAAGGGINGVDVDIRGCDTCPVESFTTATWSGLPGVYRSDPYAGVGDPVIVNRNPAEAVEIVAQKSGYLDRTVYHKMKWKRRKKAGVTQLYDLENISLYPTSSADSDGDGLTNAEEAKIGTDPNLADTDGDALPDGWEVNGHDFVDLPAMGADPLHKDVFIEVDYMTGLKPDQAAIDLIVASFANAPVSNPDGVDGITLHVDVDDLVPFDADLSPVWTEFDVIKNSYFSDHRSEVYHYCVFASQYNGGSSSGISRGIEGSDFVVSLGAPGWAFSVSEQAGTFMHELGHNLGLRHGGLDNENHKPNYLSVMSYSYQINGLRMGGVDGNYDYSRFELASLDESSLNEWAGLNPVSGINEAGLAAYDTRICDGGGCTWDSNAANNTDFNRNGVVSGTVAADINKNGVQSVLETHNDWDNIVYDGGGVLGAGAEADGLALERTVLPGDDEPCLTPEDVY